MQSPGRQPLLSRQLKDIDLVTPRKSGRDTARIIEGLGYVGEEMFNALRGSRRQLYRDPVNGRDLDVFVGEFSMCHAIPLADRLDQDAYTVPLAELMLTKLQIVELNERDERDIYSICYHHELTETGARASMPPSSPGCVPATGACGEPARERSNDASPTSANTISRRRLERK